MLYGEAFLGLWLLTFSLVLTAEHRVKNGLQDKIPILIFLDTINYSEVAPDPPGTHSGAHIKAG